MLMVAGILFLDLLMLLDQRKTNKYQRQYWIERRDWMARRLQKPTGRTKVVAQTKTPHTAVIPAGAFSNVVDVSSDNLAGGLPTNPTSKVEASQVPTVSEDPLTLL